MMHRFYGNDIFFTYFFFIFTIIATVERVRMTFKNKYPILDTKWVTTVPIMTYIAIILIGIAEYLIVTRQMNFFISVMGLFVYITGTIIRNYSISAFGESWNVHIDTAHVDHIINHGPYKYLRHPYSLAVILELIGFLLLANAYLTITMVFLVQYPLLVVRNKMEEEALVKKFGEEYMDYRKKTFSLFPELKI